MTSLFILFIICIILVKLLVKERRKTLTNGLITLPKVSGGLPIFGHFFKVTEAPYQYLNDLKDEYGPIYSIKIGCKNVIVINNFNIMKICLKEKGHTFSGRWHHVLTKIIAHDSGILFTDKEWWATQRSFTLRVLKDFGIGKNIAENVIIRESEKLIKFLRSKNNKDIEMNEAVSMATVNIISDFIMKKEYEETDEDVRFLIKSIKSIGQAADVNSHYMNVFPLFEWVLYIPKFLLNTIDRMKIVETIENTLNFISKIVEEHRKVFKVENGCVDLIDAFLFEQHKMRMSNIKDHSFTNWQLIRLIAELFLAGYETTSTTLSWSFLLFAKFSDVQSKMRDEISNEIGLIRSPTMSDKKSLNYCQAVIDEIYRFSTVLPLSIAHSNFEEASINGYFIPANSIIFPNLYACHRDYSIWKNPYDFYPKHFLDENGIYKSRPELIPFGFGKRQCLGEQLARMEVFIVVISILQKFKIHLGKKFEDIEISELLKGTSGTFRGTLPHTLRFEEIIFQ